MSSFISNPLTSMTLGVGNSLMAGYAQYNANMADNYARQWNSAQSNMAADVADAKAQMFRKLGEVESFETQQAYDRLQRQQRADYSAVGVNVNVGSAIWEQADTAAAGVYEAQKANFERVMQAIDLENQARASRLDAQFGMSSQRDPYASAIQVGSYGLNQTLDTTASWQRQNTITTR